MLALYRKYRPTSLDSVVAQSSVTTPLKNALSSGKISHSYLFTGPRGCGKTSVARILAHEINRFPYEIEDSYLDIIEIDAASNTGVDNIRDLREKTLVAPSKGKYKVYIIDEVHMLSKSAFNALLKTLEEPPAHVVFILATTDFDKVPVTIVSRSQVFRFHLATPEEITPFLTDICKKENINITTPALNLIIRRGGGSFRDTLSLLDQISTLSEPNQEITEELVASTLGLPLDSKLTDLLAAYTAGDFTAISAQLKSLLLEGLKPEQIAASVLDHILTSPDPSLLPLLSSLPSVSAPFPEAKLLLAFLSNLDNKTEKTILEKPKENKNIQKTETKSTTTNLKDFFARIRTINPVISQQIEKCIKKEEGTTLHLYPTRKITGTILSRAGNRDILISNLPAGFDLVIHDFDDLAALNSDPTVSKISDIMGGAQPLSPSDSPF